MKFEVFRFNPEVDDKPYYQSFDLDITKEDRFTVMDVLNAIYTSHDSSLSFFSHSVCNHGICGRCSVKVNGKVKLACTFMVEEDLVIEPRTNRVVKDLIVR